jgi:acyl-CoA dehydrogenase
MAIDFSLTPEQLELRRVAREFSQEVLKPLIRDADAEQDTQKAFQMVKPAYEKAYELGFAMAFIPAEYGGGGASNLDVQIVSEEICAVDPGFGCILLCNGLGLLPLVWFGSEEQKQKWLPGCASGEIVTALGMTEPGTGSDLAAIATTAVKDGDDYVINGSKTFISNGQLCDLVIVVAKTDPNPENAHKGISLFVVEAGRKGFTKGKRLHKMGMASQDTSELFFEDCRVPVANRLGAEGAGFMMLMQKLQQERLCVAIGAVAGAEQVVADTIAYTKERKAFGKPISKFQNTQFKLVECVGKVEVGRAYVDKVVAEHVAGKYLVKECSIAKFWTTDMAQEVIDDCLQFFGGYGYMLEYPVTRAFMDARVQRIYAGTNEIMKVIVAKQLGL